VLVETADEAGHRALCRDSLKRFVETSDPDAAYRMALMNLLTPDDGSDHETVRALLDRTLAASAKSGGNAYGTVIKALAEYRSNRPAEAVARLDAVLEDFAGGKLQGRYLQIQANAVRAMAHHALGQAEAARADLNRARTVAPVKLEVPADGDYSVRWHEWLILKYLLREAADLIEGTKEL
jgi:hypothetical protein